MSEDDLFGTKVTIERVLGEAAKQTGLPAGVKKFRESLANKLPGVFANNFRKGGGDRLTPYTTLSPIQADVLEHMFKHNETLNYLVQASTGQGKTLAFVLAALSMIDPALKEQQIVILAHTQELVEAPIKDYLVQLQEKGVSTTFLEDSGINCLICPVDEMQILPPPIDKSTSSKMDLTDKNLFPKRSDYLKDPTKYAKFTEAAKACQIIATTYDSYIALLKQGLCSTKNLKLVIIDEADFILFDLFKGKVKTLRYDGAIEFVNEVTSKLPQDCKIQLYSATFEDEARVRARFCVNRDLTAQQRHKFKDECDESLLVQEGKYTEFKRDIPLFKIIQLNIDVRKYGKSKAEVNRLLHRCFGPTKSLVFANTKARCGKLSVEGDKEEFCDFRAKLDLKHKRFHAATKDKFVREGSKFAREYHSKEGEMTELDRRLFLDEFKKDVQYENQESYLHSLFTTDLLARGFDLPFLDLIVNYECPISWTDKLDSLIGNTFVKLDSTVDPAILTITSASKSKLVEEGWIFKDKDQDLFIFIQKKLSTVGSNTSWEVMEYKEDGPKRTPTLIRLRNKTIIGDLQAHTCFSFASYKHRIGRTGRFNNYGLVINLIDNDLELATYNKFRDMIDSERKEASTGGGASSVPVKSSIKDLDDVLKELNVTFDQFFMTDESSPHYDEKKSYVVNDRVLSRKSTESDKRFYRYRCTVDASSGEGPSRNIDKWVNIVGNPGEVIKTLREYYDSHFPAVPVPSSTPVAGGGGGASISKAISQPVSQPVNATPAATAATPTAPAADSLTSKAGGSNASTVDEKKARIIEALGLDPTLSAPKIITAAQKIIGKDVVGSNPDAKFQFILDNLPKVSISPPSPPSPDTVKKTEIVNVWKSKGFTLNFDASLSSDQFVKQFIAVTEDQLMQDVDEYPTASQEDILQSLTNLLAQAMEYSP